MVLAAQINSQIITVVFTDTLIVVTIAVIFKAAYNPLAILFVALNKKCLYVFDDPSFLIIFTFSYG